MGALGGSFNPAVFQLNGYQTGVGWTYMAAGYGSGTIGLQYANLTSVPVWQASAGDCGSQTISNLCSSGRCIF